MENDNFDLWNEKKKKIQIFEKNLYPKNREIWYLSLWKNIWYESNWKWEEFKRPVLILKRIWTMFLIVTMTTKWKNNKYYYKIDSNYFNKESYVTLSQIKTIDKKRFIEKIWKLSEDDFTKIKKELKNLF